MSFHSPTQLRERANADSPISNGFLQRKCDRDQHTIADGEYTDLYSSGQLFNSSSIGMFAASRFGHDFSQVKLHADEASQTLPSRRTPLTVQRFPKNEDEMTAPCPTCPEAESTEASAAAEMAPEEAAPAPETENAPTPATPEPTVEAPASEKTPAPGLIVEDSTTELGPGQMRKSEFLAQLRTEVCHTVETAIAETGQTTDGCPYIGRWIDFYSRKDSAHIERAIRRYTPEASNATTARGYISAVTQRARQSAETWARTGEITGIPEGMPMGLPGMGLLGGVGRLISGIGGIFFKAREGGAKSPHDPRAIQAELGEGRPLESTARSRMESAFGMSFSHVRTHTDSTAAGLSDRLNARAFTVGKHVAFGSGEYRPGTLIGDALIAHELAHVVQQGGASASVASMDVGNASYNALEEDADKSSMGAMVALWENAKGTLNNIVQNAMPRLQSGLRLQRCAATQMPARTTELESEATTEGNLCPQFISMLARVRELTVSDRNRKRRCRMGPGYDCPTERGKCASSDSSGATITATVNTPKGCTGELAFMQNLQNADRRRTLSDGLHECMTFTTPHRDGGIPWKECTLSVTSIGRHTITTDDCPNIRLRENGEVNGRPKVHMTAASVTESFKTFLLWKPTGKSKRFPIANVTWGWSGSTTRQKGKDCTSRWTEPKGSTTDGDGRASRERPVSKPKVKDVLRRGWKKCE